MYGRFVICPGLLHKLAYSQVPLHVAAQLVLFLSFANCCSICCLYIGLPEFCVDYDILINTHCWELMWSVGSHGSLSLLLMLKVMVRHFVSDTHKVMTALILAVLHLKYFAEFPLQSHRFVVPSERL